MLLLSSMLMLTGCGDPLVDGTWRGEPLMVIEGSIMLANPEEPNGWPEGDLRVALFWANSFGDMQLEQDVGVEAQLPSRYRMEIYSPPPEEAFFYAPWEDLGQVAIGNPLLYVDQNGDGMWQEESELLVGGAPDIALVFATDETHLEQEEFEEEFEVEEDFVALNAGFQPMYSNLDYCAEEWDFDSYFPAHDDPVNLLVGDAWWGFLDDWNCDGNFEEWENLCWEANLPALCDNPDLTIGDDFLGSCLDLC
jgi:hypothetical protein